MGVLRSEVMQALLDRFDAPSYLEIGVSVGNTFHGVVARRKVAVDPRFRFDVAEARRKHPEAAYHEVPSDDYFAKLPADERFDLIYIDGLHTFEQTLRDLMNALAHIHPGSIIAIDDVYPDSLAAALPDRRDFKAVRERLNIKRNSWMGDVFKLVLFIDTFMPAWDFRCVEDNHGQLVMWQSKRPKVTERLFNAIGTAGYERVLIEHDAFRFEPLARIIETIDAARKG